LTGGIAGRSGRPFASAVTPRSSSFFTSTATAALAAAVTIFAGIVGSAATRSGCSVIRAIA
jgi:hypothetical protein